MAQIPEIVRSSLARKTGDGSAHPDANLLAAFAERTLLERERAVVVAHLAECADCRECVALAVAAMEPESPAVAERSVGMGGWFREWRWGVSAAAACCVLATALLHYGGPPVRLVSVNVSSKASGREIVDDLKTKPAAPPVPLTAAKKKLVPPPSGNKDIAISMTAAKELGSKDMMQAPAAPQPVERDLEQRRLPATTANAVSPFVEPPQGAAAPAPPPEQNEPANLAKQFGRQAGKAAHAQGLATQLKLNERAKLAFKSSEETPRVLWSINASADTAAKARGVVQRSMDDGRSWQIVPLSERVSFRAVATFEQEVWAGGSDGAVFHSADGGAHWAEVKVTGENGKPSGDIVRIDVRGPNRVTIWTASGERWTTGDGEHWTRQ